MTFDVSTLVLVGSLSGLAIAEIVRLALKVRRRIVDGMRMQTTPTNRGRPDGITVALGLFLLGLFLVVLLAGCNTVAGLGEDMAAVARWTDAGLRDGFAREDAE